VQLSIAYSPCPNDTYMLHALATGLVSRPGWQVRTSLHDVEQLNQLAQSQTYDITKLSFHGWLRVRSSYRLLHTGAALGFGCGPLLVAREQHSRERVADLRVVLPGELTTAHLLFQLWQPAAEHRLFAPYDQIFDMVEQGEADCGVVIHEGRFTYQQRGLCCLADLGEWWEDTTGLPIPLGCFAARRSLTDHLVAEVEACMTESIAHARANPTAPLTYMRHHAQELDDGVLAQHVETFVNDFSLCLGEQGLAAVDRLEEMAKATGVIT
jgi:1,4-dihydroxy-6-naphthoate synthase